MYDIKNISIRQFLAERGVSPKQERAGYGMYLSPIRTETAPSFKVDYGKNLWYDFGSGEGGSIIDLVMRLENCSVSEAMTKLENGSSFSFHRTEPVESTHSTLQIVSVKPLENRHLIDYLQSTLYQYRHSTSVLQRGALYHKRKTILCCRFSE